MPRPVEVRIRGSQSVDGQLTVPGRPARLAGNAQGADLFLDEWVQLLDDQDARVPGGEAFDGLGGQRVAHAQLEDGRVRKRFADVEIHRARGDDGQLVRAVNHLHPRLRFGGQGGKPLVLHQLVADAAMGGQHDVLDAVLAVGAPRYLRAPFQSHAAAAVGQGRGGAEQ
ncbi:MAG: hypothetical protein P8099_13145, partial [Gemmatimonadota bacterium]